MKIHLNASAGRRKSRCRSLVLRGGDGTAEPSWVREGFTLLEVIIACALFFMFAFSVLELVTRGLVAARLLQQREADAGMLASVYAQTNILIEETVSGNFDELYPDMYPDYSWVRETSEIYSNGLFKVDYAVVGSHKRRGVSETHMSILLFRPMSPPGSASQSLGGGMGVR